MPAEKYCLPHDLGSSLSQPPPLLTPGLPGANRLIACHPELVPRSAQWPQRQISPGDQEGHPAPPGGQVTETGSLGSKKPSVLL